MKISDNEYEILDTRVRQLQKAARIRVFIQTSEYGEHKTFWETDAEITDTGIHALQPLDMCTCILTSPQEFPLISAHELIFADVVEGDYVVGTKTIRAIEFRHIILV